MVFHSALFSYPQNIIGGRYYIKSIKSKIQISMLLVVLVSSILIGVITALLNANGIDEMMTKTLGPATQMAADAVEWRMNNYWTALQEAASSDIFQKSDPTAPELVPVRDDITQRNGFLYTGKMDASGFSSTGYNYADEYYFQQCKETMQPYISNIMNDGEQMIFLLEVPIVKDGQFDGIVYGGINADFLSDIVVNLSLGNEDGMVVNKVTESLNRTHAIAENVTTKVSAMVEAVEEQTAAISQVTDGIGQISVVVQNTSETSEKNAATSQELSEQSLLMNNLVRKFQLN